jgi:hypothetical protein
MSIKYEHYRRRYRAGRELVEKRNGVGITLTTEENEGE